MAKKLKSQIKSIRDNMKDELSDSKQKTNSSDQTAVDPKFKNLTAKQRKELLEEYKKINRTLKELEYRNKSRKDRDFKYKFSNLKWFPQLNQKTVYSDSLSREADKDKTAISAEMAWAQVDSMSSITYEELVSLLKPERSKEFLGMCRNSVSLARSLVGMGELAKASNNRQSVVKMVAICLYYGLDLNSVEIMRTYFDTKLNGEFVNSLTEILKASKDLSREDLKSLGAKNMTTFGSASTAMSGAVKSIVTGDEYSVAESILTSDPTIENIPKNIHESVNLLKELKVKFHNDPKKMKEIPSILQNEYKQSFDKQVKVEAEKIQSETPKAVLDIIPSYHSHIESVATKKVKKYSIENNQTNRQGVVQRLNQIRDAIESEKKKESPNQETIDKLTAQKKELGLVAYNLGVEARTYESIETIIYSASLKEAGLERDRSELASLETESEQIQERLAQLEKIGEPAEQTERTNLENQLKANAQKKQIISKSIESGKPTRMVSKVTAVEGSFEWIIQTYGAGTTDDFYNMQSASENLKRIIKKLDSDIKSGEFIGEELLQKKEECRKFIELRKKVTEKLKQVEQETKKEKQVVSKTAGKAEKLAVKNPENNNQQVELSEEELQKDIDSLIDSAKLGSDMQILSNMNKALQKLREFSKNVKNSSNKGELLQYIIDKCDNCVSFIDSWATDKKDTNEIKKKMLGTKEEFGEFRKKQAKFLEKHKETLSGSISKNTSQANFSETTTEQLAEAAMEESATSSKDDSGFVVDSDRLLDEAQNGVDGQPLGKSGAKQNEVPENAEDLIKQMGRKL